jgi:hypothetical protein
MGNLSSLMFGSTPLKTVNKGAFDYYGRPCDYKNSGDYVKQGVYEVETDDFSKIEDIRKKLLELSDQLITNEIREDVITALDNYLNTNKPCNKIILSQTDYFVFTKTNPKIPFLSIKNTQAEANREKLSVNVIETTKFTGYYVASCDLSKLWTHF